MRLAKRVGPDPHGPEAWGPKTPAADGCPDVWQLDSGDYAVIGIEIASTVERPLPPTASCGPDETIVMVPKRTLEAAAFSLTAAQTRR